MSTVPVRLSATLIVRNEADHLRRCLASIRPFTDEIIVVDTGSSDDSRTVASSFGARVFDRAWTGDFSAARNHALDQATGSWILYIDADEVARPIDAETLRAELADPTLVAATVRFRNRTGVTLYREYRLFLNHPRIRFHNVIHETMVGDIFEVAREEGRRIGQASLTLDHHGYDGNQDAKHRRNIPLLRARLVADPEHVYSWNHLGQALAGVGDAAGARDAWARAIDIVRTRGVRSPLDALPFGSLLESQQPGVDAGLVEEARARFPGDLLFQYLEGRRLTDAERFAEALPLLEPLAAIDPEEYCSETGVGYDVGIFPAAAEAVALCCFQVGRYADAARLYAGLVDAAPADVGLRARHHLAAARAAGPASRSSVGDPAPAPRAAGDGP